MAALTKKIVISGYYGFDNSGDEAVLQSILLALQASAKEHNLKIEPIVLSANPEHTEAQYGVRAVSRKNVLTIIRTLRQADGLISGGGSLLQDVTGRMTIPYYLGIIKCAQWLRKPVFIYAQGLGPVKSPVFHDWIRSVFIKATYISVRDIESKKWLTQLGVAKKRSIALVPDPVMALPLPELSEASIEPTNQKQWIALSVRFWQSDNHIIELAKALNELLQDERICIRLLPFHMPSDEQASLKLMEGISSEYHQRVQMKSHHNPQKMLAEVGRCQLLIGMRLHALIYAANRAVPMIGISYDPKIDQFLARLDMQSAATTESCNPAVIVALARALLADSNQWRVEKQELLAMLKQEAVLPSQAICEYFAPRDGEQHG